MTQEDKELLFKDLCARLPYGVKVHVGDDWAMTLRQIDYKCFCECWENEDIKSNSRWMLPYLRPMSSMTKEELKTFYKIEDMEHPVIWNIPQPNWNFSVDGIDWLLSKQFDYRGLIEKGLALEAPEEMYN